MKVFVALALFVAAAAAASYHDETFLRREFTLFQKKFGKTYKSPAEREERFAVFKANVDKIQRHNLVGLTWQEGINKFSDMTEEEFRQQYLSGYVNMKKPSSPLVAHSKDIDLSQLPDSVDWRDSGAITGVKDQGSCGSCWAFASVQSIESYVQINNGSLLELSAQQITSCTPNELECGGTGGCSGSIPQLGWLYSQLFNVALESDYGYVSGNSGSTGSCDYDPTTAAATVMGYEILPRNNYAAVMAHLANVGPLSVAVDASAWGFYFGGVFDGCPYDQNIAINHAVQLVGYGTDADDGDYWLVRNSWGAGWGESGYIRLRRQTEPQCGTDSTPLSGVACVNDGNDEQYVCGTCAVLFDVGYPMGAQVL